MIEGYVVSDALPEHQLDMVPIPSDEWRPVRPSSELRSQIVLYYANSLSAKKLEGANTIRCTWLNSGSVITAYDGGRGRFSLPPKRQRRKS